MRKMINNLHAQPRLTVYSVNEPHTAPRRPSRRISLHFIVTVVFIVGGLTGAVVMARDQLGKAGVAEAEPAPASTTEPWSLPLEFDNSELAVVSDLLPILIAETRHEPTPEEMANTIRKENLREYFVNRKSPFAKDDATLDAFLSSKNMNLMIAISFSESTMGQRCYYNNCSGIGGTPPRLRKYGSHAEWITDFDSLLERRYKGLPVEKFIGLYVQPGTPAWTTGVNQILAELKEAGIE